MAPLLDLGRELALQKLLVDRAISPWKPLEHPFARGGLDSTHSISAALSGIKLVSVTRGQNVSPPSPAAAESDPQFSPGEGYPVSLTIRPQ